MNSKKLKALYCCFYYPKHNTGVKNNNLRKTYLIFIQVFIIQQSLQTNDLVSFSKQADLCIHSSCLLGICQMLTAFI